MRIVHQPGNDELRQPPRYEGALPSTRTIEGRSSLLDETTFCDLSQFDVPLADHREQLRDRALRFAQAFGHTAQPLIASELLSPELVTAIPGDIEPHQQRGILSVLGLCCRDLAVSQDIHRGFFRLTPAVGQTVMRQLAEES